MTIIAATAELYGLAREHLGGRVEQVGFFQADFDDERLAFVLRAWRPMPPEAFESQSAYHVTLRDEVRPQLIQWAWDAAACLVEIHSHRRDGPATFSPSDIWGLGEWVPHVRWRLRGRPYAAIVTAGESFDALAWLDREPSQIEQLQVGDQAYLATARTLPRLAELAERGHGI